MSPGRGPRGGARRRLSAIIRRPVIDTADGLDRCLAAGPRGLVLMSLGLVLGWWVYVPCHELLHAAGCIATGGTVSRLSLAPIYGGRVLHAVLPIVAAGSGRASRLSGFDTGGSDLVYLATDLAPYLLTLFPGVWALREAGASGRPFLFGLALPVALAPFVSLTGDAYEIGSILVTNLPPWSTGALETLLRGDDLFDRTAAVRAVGGIRAPLGLGLATVLGAVWATATYHAGAAIAARRTRPAPSAQMPSSSIFRRSVDR